MRIFKFLITSVILIGVLGLVSLLAIREALLIWGVAQLRADLSRLKQIDRNRDEYVSQCRKLGAVLDSNIISSFQLRFTSDREYVTEVICSQFQLSPLEVNRAKLPMFVIKKPGSSGIFWGDQLSGVILQVWGRQRAVLVEQKEIIYQDPGIDLNLGEGPLTTCDGYGFNCCAKEVSQGIGDQFTGVADCPKSCFSQCTTRPIVLAFLSDPFMDPQTRLAQVERGQSVTFNYVIETQAEVASVKIIYGDGQVEESLAKEGSFSHVYSCPNSECNFEVFLTVQDQAGAEAMISPISKITVVVK